MERCDLQIYYNLPLEQILQDTQKCQICAKTGTASKLVRYAVRKIPAEHFYCPQCGFSGKSIDYLAAVNGLSLPEQIESLAQQGFIDDTDSKRSRFVNERKYWKNTKQYVENLQKYIAGNMYLDEIENFKTNPLFHYTKTIIKKQVQHLLGKKISFSDWDNASVVPLYNWPYSLSGVLLINSHTNFRRQYRIRNITSNSVLKAQEDIGYIIPKKIPNPEEPVIMCSDPLTAIRLQSDYFRQENRFPNVAGWIPTFHKEISPIDYSWDYLSAKKVFWSFSGDYLSMRQAALTNSSFSSVFWDENNNYRPNQTLPAAVVKNILKNAKVWQRGIEQFLSEGNIRQKIEQLALPLSVLEKFISYTNPLLKEKILQVLPSEKRHRWITIDNLTYTEKNSKIYLIKNREVCVCNLFVDLQNIYHLPNGGLIYQGNIEIEDKMFPFATKNQSFSTHPKEFVSQTLIENECPIIPDINLPNNKLIRIIKHFGNARLNYIKDKYGWDSGENTFNTPNLKFSYGTVITAPADLNEEPLNTMKTEHTRTLEEGDKTTLNLFGESPYIFSAMQALALSCFAYAFKAKIPQTIITGGDIFLISRLFKLLVLPEISIKKREDIAAHRKNYNLPFLTEYQQIKERKWIDTIGFNENCFICTGLKTAAARTCYADCVLLVLPAFRFYKWFDGKLPNLFITVFANLLKHLSAFVPNSLIANDFVTDILEETKKFFIDETGITPANNLFNAYSGEEEFLADFLNILIESESAQFVKEKDTWFVNKDDVKKAFRKHLGVFDQDELNKYGNIKFTQESIEIPNRLIAESRKRFETIYKQ
ncbi:MAG: hypothetical protein LBT46_00595 [Planctomycetaceae bacterium]|jgi:hypothetical protein|nr:hypothetical protein [Planctomycetaceae bacterium]